MDKPTNGQDLGVPITKGSGNIQPPISDEKPAGEPEKDSNNEFMNGRWKKDQKIDFSNLISGLTLVRSALEKSVEVQKLEIERIQSKISQFNK
jgi:hypothetical protein